MAKEILKTSYGQLAAAALSGILCALSYPPFPAWAIAFAFVPLWLCLVQIESVKRAVALTFLTQFLITVIGFYWVAYTAEVFGQIPFPLSIMVLIGFCMIGNLHFVAAVALAALAKKRFALSQRLFIFNLVVFTGAFEFLWPNIFPWNLGYSLYHSHLSSAQTAELIGFQGLSSLMYLLNGLITLLIHDISDKKLRLKFGGATLALILALQGIGFLLLKNVPAETSKMKVLMVQTNMGSYELFYRKYGKTFQKYILEKLFSQTDRAIKTATDRGQKPELVIWSETAFPDYLDPAFESSTHRRTLIEFIKTKGVHLVTGGFSRDPFLRTPQTPEYSGLFLFGPNGDLMATYRKNILLAFGEQLPGAKYFPFIRKLAPEIGELTPGAPPVPLPVNEHRLLPSICYEDLYSSLFAPKVGDAHVLLNITNDSWYGNGPEQIQHMTMAAARTVEFRRPLVRSTNTGLSAVIDQKGDPIYISKPNQEEAKYVEVPYNSKPKLTVFSLWAGYQTSFYMALVLGIILLDIILYAKYRRTRLESTPQPPGPGSPV